MTDDIAGKGDPLWVLGVLWGKAPPPKRGPKPKASLTEIVAAAVTIADAEGIGAVSVRRVAEAVGISTMALYTHVPSMGELHDLMLDQIATPGTQPPADWTAMPWRDRLTLIATSMWDFHLEHPWVIAFQTHRPSLGPNTMAAYEVALGAVEGIGLGDLEMDLTVTVFMNYVVGAVRFAAREKLVNEQTGMSDTEWWYRVAPFLETLDYSPYPISSRVGPVAGAEYGVGDHERAFRFGVEMLLDGLEVRLRRAAGQSNVTD